MNFQFLFSDIQSIDVDTCFVWRVLVSEKRVGLYSVFILYKNVVGPGALYVAPSAHGPLDSNIPIPTLPCHRPEVIYSMYVRSAVFNEVHTREDLKRS